MVKRWCFDNLTLQMKSATPEGQVVAGCLFCLNNVLFCEEENFAAHINDNADKLFQIILQVLTKYLDATRYVSVQAALELFSQHTPIFATMLTLPNQWKDLFNVLQYWASHHNIQTYKFGLRAFEQYIRQVSCTFKKGFLYETNTILNYTAFYCFTFKLSRTSRTANIQSKTIKIKI